MSKMVLLSAKKISDTSSKDFALKVIKMDMYLGFGSTPNFLSKFMAPNVIPFSTPISR